jgi:hypothetical protein
MRIPKGHTKRVPLQKLKKSNIPTQGLVADNIEGSRHIGGGVSQQSGGGGSQQSGGVGSQLSIG